MLEIIPMKQEAAPKYPTAIDVGYDSRLLKKLPNRWQKSKGVLMCLGTIGVLAFTGCTSGTEPEEYYYEGDDIKEIICDWSDMHLHHGGAGFMPMYVADFTEQEALAIIHNKATAAGFNFVATESAQMFPLFVKDVLDNSTDSDEILGYITIDYFDEEKGVAFAHIHDWWSLSSQAWQVLSHQSDIITITTGELSQDGREVIVAVFVNPAGWSVIEAYSSYELDATLLETKEQLAAQVREFLEWLENNEVH